MQTYAQMLAKMVELNGFGDRGINWESAQFETTAEAWEFCRWLDSGWESRGVLEETGTHLACCTFRRSSDWCEREMERYDRSLEGIDLV